jgi:HAD superfamily phosphoserine phosphatase-like hydrolase
MNLALFDFDGTITTRETFPDFIRHAITPRRLRLGRITLAPLVAGYRLGLVSGTAVRAAIVKVGFSGTALSRYEAAGESFARDVLPGSLRPEAMRRIAWHQQQGDTVAGVSGAFDAYLGHWCASHGLDLLCSSLEHRRGVLTGRYAGEQCVLAERRAGCCSVTTCRATARSLRTATLRRTTICSPWRTGKPTAGRNRSNN